MFPFTPGFRCGFVSACTLVLSATLAPAGIAQERTPEIVRATQTRPQASASTTADGRVERVEFQFGLRGDRGWLARNGEMYLDAWVQHQGLLCATYETGLRFGIGEQGCANARWVNGPYWLTRLRQCNNAVVQHVGNDTARELAEHFDGINCVERLVRCTGRCN
jgi:hypothetical protein